VKSATVDCHESAVVHDGARLGEGVRVGPHCVIGENVELGPDTVVQASTVIDGNTKIGARCRIFPFASIGLEPQDLKFKGEPTSLTIGDDNVFREFVTIHRGTALGGGTTKIGDGNLFMAYTHVAHDCVIGSHTIFGNGAALGGHVVVEDHATISAYSGVHQFCRIGAYAFTGAYTVVPKDVLPFSRTVGNRACLYGANAIGLERRGFDKKRIEDIRAAFRVLQQQNLNVGQALQKLEEDDFGASSDVRMLVEFVRSSERGVIVKRAREDGD